MNTDHIRTQLQTRLAELEYRAERVTLDASHRDAPVSADFAEQAVERENDEVLSAIADESYHEAQHIRAALQRLEQGAYGICTECGEIIAEERLLAVPYATHCVQCAS